MNFIYELIISNKQKSIKSLAILIDPEKFNPELIQMCNSFSFAISFFFVGGSTASKAETEKCIRHIKNISSIPVVIFPGNSDQICSDADALLLLSLFSGRNAEFIIGEQVRSAFALKESKLELIPTAYMLLGEHKSSAAKVSATNPISFNNKTEIVATALAAEQLGMKMIYLEGGSGANESIPNSVISEVTNTVSVPIIVGGGIRSKEALLNIFDAGADIAVVGNALEENPFLIQELIASLKQNQTL